ncbi:MAG: sulfur-carrier protein [Frankiales bacterium]|nr:sulfur-carrier protein [Frankiales bacterium]
MTDVTVRFWAAAREAAGRVEEHYPAGSLAEVVAEASHRHGDRLARILASASFLVDDDPVGKRQHADVLLGPGSVLEVLPPFAGG